jgi:uncharacterized tellurite resistance protein B-like protein
MFLSRLHDREKGFFLLLAHHVAQSDKEVTSEEGLIIAQYCFEMGENDVEYSASEFDLETLLDQFDEDHRNIIVLELTVLAYADGKMSTQESIILDQVVNHFNITPEKIALYREWAKNVMSLSLQGEALIKL